MIKPADREWIAQCLYEPTGQLKQQLSQNWFYPQNPQSPPKSTAATSDPTVYFRQRMFLWAPMWMWIILLKCHQCNRKIQYCGIYTMVIDLDSRYYLVSGDNPLRPCAQKPVPCCPHYTVGTRQEVCHIAKTTNCSSYLQQAMEELHSEAWARRVIEYLSDCELHKKRSTLTQSEESVYDLPSPFSLLPLAQ